MIKEDFGELDDIGFLREAELFRDMPESVIRTILSQAETQLFGADDVVVHKGDAGDSLFVVKSGVVEVSTPAGEGPPLAYLGRGDCFGELALLTGSDRSNDIRVPQQAELLVIDRALFQDLMSNHAGFGGQLAIILAHRLVGLLEDLPERGHKRELQGDLRYFDLTTVVQTLITSAQTGVMTFTSDNETAAELHFQGGNIYRARFAHRRGDEAVHNLFQDQPQGEFRFESHEADEVNEGPDPGITVPAMALMMESVRLQDELKMLLEDLPTEGTRLQRNRDTLEWTGDEGQADARQLWGCLHQPVTLADLFARSHACRYHAARVLTRMLQTEQIRPSVA
ncbi:MAG TPA: cyclic nucleotide-binding domain-containing protein [Vicinamibacteria bacterium]|nr:cyclic nucleotide-binding domain-containing protein [Vicinamibacteria bacterium]